MATGETPAPAYSYSGGAMPFGQATDLATQQVSDQHYQQTVGPDTPDPPQDFIPANDAEQFLTSPTDRPLEPMTQGAPFGPGSAFSPHAYENDRSFLQRVTSDLMAQGDSQVSEFAARVARGE